VLQQIFIDFDSVSHVAVVDRGLDEVVA